jgi:alpha-beta hydrolase superfamily lysophospholipase/SAM-dependent methyltransferase
VVLCNPLGYEAMCVHGTYRHLAQRLATAGFHALRFDYHGTGDSSGDDDEPDRVRAWLESIDAAVEALRVAAGVRAVALVGVRFGATLAAVAAAGRRDVQSLVLWAPCASGRAYLRELRALRMLEQQNGAGASGAHGEDGEGVAGYRFHRATVDELAAIDLLARRERLADRALVVSRDDLPDGAERLASHLAACGVDARLCTPEGYASMMRDPQDVRVPFGALDAIVAWLEEAREPRSRDAFRAGAGAPSPVLTAVSRKGRAPAREEPIRFGEGGRLFGVLTEPGAGSVRRGSPAVVFLNVGANHRVGPNRMYVTLARELAARGYRSLRFDLGGLGDSLVAEGAPSIRLYSKDSIGDVKAALSTIARARGVDRVVLAGVCSGAYLAFYATIEDPRVIGQILINPQTFVWREGDSLELSIRRSYKSTRYYLARILDREVWSQAVRGRVDLRGVAGVLRERYAARAGAWIAKLLARGLGAPAPRTGIERAFCALSDRGGESLLVFASTDGGLDMIEEHLGRDARRMRGRRNFRLAIVEGADHTFTPIASQRELGALVTSFVEGAFPCHRDARRRPARASDATDTAAHRVLRGPSMSYEAARVMDQINRDAWREPSAVRRYRSSEGWTDRGERAALATVAAAAKGQPILDLGVGGGRTVPLLRAISHDYTAVDYTPELVEACKARYPDALVLHGDARDLSRFADGSFQLAVFSYNGIDSVNSEDRIAILRGVHRVLRPGGAFVFSAHNREGPGPREGFSFGVDLTRNPLKLAARVAGRALHATRSLRNYRRYSKLAYEGAGFSIANASANDHGILVHYATLGYQLRQLQVAGFQPDPLIFANVDGRLLKLGEDNRDVWWFHFVARK